MEFSYRISEAEYLSAAKLRLKAGARARLIKHILLWAVALGCLVLLTSIFYQHMHQPPTELQEPVETAAPEHATVGQLVGKVVPAILVVGAWFFFMFRLQPMLLRRRYRKDPSMQGQFTVDITPESIGTQNTAGTSGRTGWNIYDYWREGKDIILLVFHSGAYLLLSVADLSEAQRDELRGILAATLPKK